jgi:hypothetical protein
MKKVILVTILLSLSFYCTNPFSNREVNPPGQHSSIDISDNSLFNYDSVLVHLRYAMNQKNIDKYMACFIDTSLVPDAKYRFIPDNRLSLKFDDWDLKDENNYIHKVFQDYKNVELTYMDTIKYLSTNWHDSVQTDLFQYRLSLQNNNSTNIYTGKAIMKFIKNINSQWAIYFWEDIAIADSNSWSLLKALNR